jgi:hypothetical protein
MQKILVSPVETTVPYIQHQRSPDRTRRIVWGTNVEAAKKTQRRVWVQYKDEKRYNVVRSMDALYQCTKSKMVWCDLPSLPRCKYDLEINTFAGSV